MGKKNRRFGTGVQALEEKAMMAGDAAVIFSGGELTIQESFADAGQDQYVQVSQLSNGDIEVRGVKGTQIRMSAGRGTFTSDAFTFSGVQDIDVNLGGGDDNFQMMKHNGGVDIHKLSIDTGSGNDTVRIDRLNATGLVEIETGDGHDRVNLNQSNFNKGWGDSLKVNMGDGSDDLHIFRSNLAADLFAQMYEDEDDDGFDRDEISIAVTQMDDMDLRLGDGNDDVVLQFATFDQGSIDAGDGADDVYAESVDANELDYDGGAGADEFYARYYYYGTQDSNSIGNLNLESASFLPTTGSPDHR